MKKIFPSIVVALVSLPIAGFACGAGDCSMDLPQPEVPAPTTVENLLNSLSDHTGLFAAMALAAIIGLAIARQGKLLATKSSAPSFGSAS